MPAGTPTKAGSTTGTTQVSSASLTTTTNIPAGDLILVSVSRQFPVSATALTSVTDTVGNTYTLAKGSGDTGFRQFTELWYCANPTALPSGDTVTLNGMNLQASCSWSFSVWFVSGVATSSPVDKTAGGNNNSTTWHTSPQTTNDILEFLWGVFGANQDEPAQITNAASLPTNGWIARDSILYGPNTLNSLRTVSNTVGSIGSYQIGGSSTTGEESAYVFVAFILASQTANTGIAVVGSNGGDVTDLTVRGTVTLGNNGGGEHRANFEVGGSGGLHRENYEVGGSGGLNSPYSFGSYGGLSYPIGVGGGGGIGFPGVAGQGDVGSNPSSGVVATSNVFIESGVLTIGNNLPCGIPAFYGHIGTPGGSWQYYTLLVWRNANGGWSNVVVKRWRASTSSWRTL